MKYDVDSHFRVPTETVLRVTTLAPVAVLITPIIFYVVCKLVSICCCRSSSRCCRSSSSSSSCWSCWSLEKLAILFSMHLITVMTRGADNEVNDGVPSQGASSSGGQPEIAPNNKHLLFKNRLFKNGALIRFVKAYLILLPLQLFTLAIIAVNVVFVEEYEGNSCQWYNSTVLPEKEFYSCRLRRKFIDNGVRKIDDYCNNSTGESPGESADDILCIQFYFYKSRLLTVATSLVVWNGVVAPAMLYVVIFYRMMVDIFPVDDVEKSKFDIWLEASCTCKWIPRSFVRCLSCISMSFVHLFAWIPSLIILGLVLYYKLCTNENTQSDLIVYSALISCAALYIMMLLLCYYLISTKTCSDENYNHFDAYPLVGVVCAENKNKQVNQVVNNENNDSSALVSQV